MPATPVDARLRKRAGESMELVIRTADLAIRAEFRELVACTFPTKTTPPIHVELPPTESRGLALVSASRVAPQPTADNGYPHAVKVPIYREQSVVDRRVYDQAPRNSAREILTRMPILALAGAVRADRAGADVQTHCVLPIWADGSAILVTLDWFGGSSMDRASRPDWRVSASSGLPAAAALRQFADFSATVAPGTDRHFQFCLTPWVLGAELLRDDGVELRHRVWQREWRFDSLEEFAAALQRVVSALLDSDPFPGGTAA